MERLSEEQKLKLLKDYEEATKEESLEPDKWNPLNKRSASPEVARRFADRLAEIFPDDAPYCYVPYWAIQVEYDKIQDAVDEYAVYLREWEVRKFVRIWMSQNTEIWRDRSPRNHQYMRFRENTPWGHKESSYCSGYAKMGVSQVNVETDVWPKGGHTNRRGRAKIERMNGYKNTDPEIGSANTSKPD